LFLKSKNAFQYKFSGSIFAFLNPLMIRFLIGYALFFVLVCPANGQWRAPKYSNEFLSIGIGAAGIGLASTQVSSVNDVTSAYWNPAGLASLNRQYEVSLMHASYFAGIANFDYAGFATKVDSQSVLALSFIRFGVDDIPDTRYLIDNGQVDYRRISSFSSSDNALFFSYSRRNVGIKGLSVGGSLKVIYRNAGSFANAWGFGLDAGLQYQRNHWNFGLMARDVATTFNVWTYNTVELEQAFSQTNNTIPVSSVEITLPAWILGISRNFEVLPGKLALRPMTDWVLTFDGRRNTLVSTKAFSADPRLGLEIKAFEMVSLRGGIAGWQKIKNFENGQDWNYQINFGIGMRWKAITVDYALTDLGNQAEALYSHIFSLKAAF
jgi:hypothetical protein